MAVTFDLLIF